MMTTRMEGVTRPLLLLQFSQQYKLKHDVKYKRVCRVNISVIYVVEIKDN